MGMFKPMTSNAVPMKSASPSEGIMQKFGKQNKSVNTKQRKPKKGLQFTPKF